ncbi:MAG: hypothetical protein LC134_02180 [Chitinophagales bacterium]|nr:hypothetical protein [Chitinophagaceae bacterium]MCZ2298269.1 hypothetical protein [Chitinophagales bacterium]
MERKIKIFKTSEEQEAYTLQQQSKTTPLERFRNLFYMQQLSKKFHSVKNSTRKITVHHGYFTS